MRTVRANKEPLRTIRRVRMRIRALAAAGCLWAAVSAAGCTTDVVDFLNPVASGPSRYVKYTCCKTNEPEVCVEQVLGSATSCKDPGSWKSDAGMACEASGMYLTAYAPYVPCSLPDAGAN